MLNIFEMTLNYKMTLNYIKVLKHLKTFIYKIITYLSEKSLK